MKKMMRIFIAGLATVFLALHVAAQQSPATQKDTLCISSAGTNNQVIINSKNVTRLNDCTDSLAVKGEIVQRGENNSVEINTERKPQAASSDQLKRSGNPNSPGKQATIKIKQSGNNNTAKINSR